jgi:tetratricopeptide (TPR) repeat protein
LGGKGVLLIVLFRIDFKKFAAFYKKSLPLYSIFNANYMKKILFLFCGLMCLQSVFAQRSAMFSASDRLFREGKTMFDEGNYAGCIAKMLEYEKSLSTDAQLLEDAEFLTVASNFYLNRENTVADLRRFLEKYPVSIHKNEICFMTGSDYFRTGDFKQAVFWFKQTDIDRLSLKEQEDYAYRMGLASLETSNLAESVRLFGLLRQNSSQYRDAATFYLAYINFVQNDYQQALSFFNEVKDKREYRADVLYYIAQINFAQGRYAQTITDGRNLLADYPSHKYNIETKRIIGLSYFDENNYEKTVQYLGDYIDETNFPASEDLYFLGLAYFYQKDYRQAITVLNKTNAGDSELGQNVYLHLGQAYLKQHDAQKALMAFQSAARMDFSPETKEAASYNYAMLLHQNSVSAFGESVTALENFINDYPESIYADRVNDALIDVYLTTKDYDTALASIAKIKNPGAKIREAQQKIYYYLGTVSFTNSQYQDAIKYFTNAVSAGNYAADARNEATFWRGESYYKLNNYSKANTDFQTFLNSGYNKTGNLARLAVYNSAYCAFNQKHYDEARRGFIRYTSIETESSSALADAYARLGDCYFFERQFTEAENAYNRAVAVAPSKADYALYQKGYVLGLQKDYAGKIAQMDRLIAEYPESPCLPDAMYEKGRAYVLMENTNKAIETYRLLCNRFPENSNARKAGLQIGLLYFNANQPAQAATAYKEVVAKYPGSEEAKTAVQDLKSVYFELNDVSGYADYVKSLGGAVKFDVSERDSMTYLAAERLFMRNENTQAQKGMLSYLQSFPDGAFSANAHYYLGQTYYMEKNFAAAQQEFRQVVAAGNNQFTEDALIRLSTICYNNGEYEEALPLYERLQNTAENKTARETGAIGLVRTASRLGKTNQVVTSANLLMKTSSADLNLLTEAQYYRAKAYLTLGEKSYAEQDLKELSKDTRTVFGAEAKYLLAQFYFDNKQSAKAKETVQDYIKQGTPHAYWLARSFILMSDIFAAEGEKLQARQYLESLQNNYKGKDDDITSLILKRLQNL